MKIEVAVEECDTQKDRGDLLEKLAERLLRRQNYSVTTEMRVTGIEVDLLCTHNVSAKEIYVECKAHREKINAGIIDNLIGKKTRKKYSEAWLLSTSSFGKEAKGVIKELKDENRTDFSFYSPTELVSALVESNTIHSAEVAKQTLIDFGIDESLLRELMLLLTKYGNFWAAEILNAGVPVGIICVDAGTNKMVVDLELLGNLSRTDCSLKSLDFLKVREYRSKSDGDFMVSDDEMRLNKNYLSKINDIGIKLHHPDKEELFLDDTFVFPDLQNLEEDNKSRISSAEILGNKPNLSKCMIFGDDVSGKTSLALTLQKRFNVAGLIPIYIAAQEIKRSDFKNFKDLLTRKFGEQYNGSKPFTSFFENILSKESNRIIIIVDSFEHLSIKREAAKLSFFENLNKNFSRVYIFSNTSLEIEVIAKSETREMLKGFAFLKIRQFGHVLRDNLIEKWISIGNGDIIPDRDILEKKNEIAGKIKVIVGRNFIPTYPLYLLTIFQLIEAGNGSNKLQGGVYAELYRYLIDQALWDIGIKPDDIDFYYSYLSYTAHYSFINRSKELSEEDLREVFDRYSYEMDVKKSFNNVCSNLAKAKLLKYEEGSYKFGHSYIYYFFVAKYFADNMEESAIEEEINAVIKRLYKNEYANIIIFLIHHTKNKGVIDKIIHESSSLFSQISPSTLSSEEVASVNKLIQEEIRLTIQDSNPHENRRKDLELKDKLEAEENDDFYESEELIDGGIDALDMFSKINLTFKLMEILGQITKNSYSSLSGAKKVEILTEVYSVGFRALNVLLSEFEKYLDVTKECIVDEIWKKNLASDDDKYRIADRLIYHFFELIVLTFIKKTGDSFASKNLFPTIEKIGNDGSVSSVRLACIAAKLNFPNGVIYNQIFSLDSEFGKNILTKRLLRYLVIEHLYKFDLPFNEKQRICDRLDICYEPKMSLIKRGNE